MMRAARVVQRNALVYRRVWRASVFSNFLQPTLYLLALGLGVGGLVDPSRSGLPTGVTFVQFLAPGLLASACVQTASFEAAWPVMGKLVWYGNYKSVVVTPIDAGDLVVGELAWIAVRAAMVATTFLGVMFVCGVAPVSLASWLAVPVAVLTGLAFSAAIIPLAAVLKQGSGFNVVFRFCVTPLFLFSGVFFPISRIPAQVRWLAPVSPLFHGVEMTRGLVLQQRWPDGAAMHLAYLLSLVVLGCVGARWTFRRKLHA
jgi:lipooligosaccharide transport system permease protein